MIKSISRLFPVADHSLSYNRSIDGLRGIAVGIVLIFHIWPEIFSFGYVGVDVFFVLSGYLITQIIHKKLLKDKFSFKEFYRNRVRRIFPSMLIVTSAALFIGWLILMPEELIEVAKHVKSSSLFYQNFRLMSEAGYWDTAAHLKPLLHYWSLSIEEQYYLLWPALILVIYRLKCDFFYSLLFVTAFLMVLPHLLGVDLFFHSFSRFWELSAGGLTYAVTVKYPNANKIVNYERFILIFFAIGIALCFGTETYNTFKIMTLIASTCLVVLLVTYKPEHKLFSNYPLVFLGLISYPLYLWHYVIISYLHILAVDVSKYGFYIMLVSIIVSYFTYRFVEHYTRGVSSYRFAIILVILALSLAYTAQYVRHEKGLPGRSHIKLKTDYAQQFKKPLAKNKDGMELVKSVLGYLPDNNYIKATSSDKTKKFVLLTGDSHATAAYDGLAEELSKSGYETVLLANSGCSPIINGEMGVDREKLEKCAEKIDNIYKFIDKFDSVQKIILAPRGPLYAYQSGFAAELTDKVYFREYFDDKSDYDNTRLYFEKIDKTFSYFSTRNELYYLHENPELGFHPGNYCNERPFGLGIKDPDCSITYESYKNRVEGYRAEIDKLAGKYRKIHTLDPEGAFCRNGYCYAVIDDKMLYRDDDHLSINGSKLQARYIINQLLR